ncbi:MAG: 2TM domain-containing protein [Flavobacteriaceae bacterium]|nr:2TM domain-containing protein [Flavobacteriaceae bacterium]
MTNFIKTFVIGLIIGTIIFLIFFAIEILGGGSVSYDEKLLRDFGYYQLYSVVLTFVNGYWFDYLNHKVNWEKYTEYRLLIGALGGVAITIMSVFFIRIFIYVGIKDKTFSEFIESENGVFYVISLLITVVISAFFHAFYLYREVQKDKVKEQKIIAGTASAQFDALKNQLDPHFLFNSLNVLTSLIDENPENAQRFTTSLSKVYRYVLEQKNKELVSVDEELQFAKTYVRLLKMRFEDSIIFEIPEKANNPEAKVVPLSLQLLLENAVKHNIVNASKPLHIKIYENQGNLIVENNLQSKKVLKKGSGVGLVNIQQRYSLLTKRKVNINKTTSAFIVQLPMLTKQSSVMRTVSSTKTVNSSYVRARKRVDKLKDFYGSLVAYVIVIPFLIFINMYTFKGFHWFWFPMLGWGVGLAFQAYEVYGKDKYFGKSWEDRKMQEYMNEETENKNRWE